jgi:hypothetical protein
MKRRERKERSARARAGLSVTLGVTPRPRLPLEMRVFHENREFGFDLPTRRWHSHDASERPVESCFRVVTHPGGDFGEPERTFNQ